MISSDVAERMGTIQTNQEQHFFPCEHYIWKLKKKSLKLLLIWLCLSDNTPWLLQYLLFSDPGCKLLFVSYKDGEAPVRIKILFFFGPGFLLMAVYPTVNNYF